ncbi:ATP-binding protein [Devosia sp.]|uniref:ATP-binding protein n=1 Tax=Devosia sp. TaxID=1871048 RepID=UPI001ACCBEF2|nr:ATP-binding protein [Devosia sp.]MBN9335189.1 ATP-binding protein [Devosia sp.]
MTISLSETQIKEAFAAQFFPPPEFDAITAAVEEVYAHVAVRLDESSPWGEGNRAPCSGVLVTADTRFGKTTVVQQVVNGLSELEAIDGTSIDPNSFYYECPSTFTNRLMLNGLLMGIHGGESTKRPLTTDAAYMRVQQELPVFRPTMAIIDEFQYAIHPAVGAAKMSDSVLGSVGIVRNLLNHAAWPLPVVVVGMPELIPHLEKEQHRFLGEKLIPVELAPMKLDDPAEEALLEQALLGYCAAAGIGNAIVDKHFYQRLIHATNRARGLAFELMQVAVLNAWREGRIVLTEHDFAHRYFVSTRAIDAQNPFIVAQWRETDRSRLMRSEEEAVRTVHAARGIAK